ncbi:MAG: class I SAM-dependent rRNA methyltransferase [Verrucomicrobia bacterium]|nr:class I SAM-dependent rRNA methyltransferase [Verrucomicrobiota bacterium]
MTDPERGALRLKPGGRSKALAGHPWILKSEIEEDPGIEWRGRSMVAKGPQGELIGTGFYRNDARVAWRRFRKDIGNFDSDFVEKTIQDALNKRKNTPARRILWSESDGMPGLVLDQYGKYLVAQITTEGMENHWGLVRSAVEKIIRPDGIWIRRDASGRKLEGLEMQPGEAVGTIPEKPVLVEIGKMNVWVDLRSGQKTGTYLDQQENYGKVANEARGRKVLDLFCHNGGFALRASQAGAIEVTGVDTSRPSLELARQSAEYHGLKVRWAQEDVTRYLRTCRKGGYDLVILDPPGLVKSRDSAESGSRLMTELHRSSMKVLARGGLLATFSCSHRVSGEELLRIVRQVAKKEGRLVQIKCILEQSSDHPVDPAFPESRYLSGFLLEVS